MRIVVNYGLPFREDIGVRDETYEIEGDSATVAAVLEQIARRHLKMSRYVAPRSEEAQRREMVVAVNSRVARLSDDVHDGDRVSLLLPVVGGSEE